MNNHGDGHAFPTDAYYDDKRYGIEEGISKRDYFAAKALPAVIAAYVEANGQCIGTDHVVSNCVAHAYRFADAMLAERKKRAS